MQRVYFDHAATSWPRLPGVIEAMADFERQASASAGRGGHASAVAATNSLQHLRIELARSIHALPDEIGLFCNGTAANNYALAGVLKHGDHVITTRAEHNSVLRPLRLLEQQRGIEWTALPVDRLGRLNPSDIKKALRSNTKLLVCSSASNVTGAVNNLESIGSIAKEHNILFMVDAAQSLGYLPLHVDDCHIDLMAAPGHKGLGGPLGTALLFAKKTLHVDWQPLWIGGTGSMSEQLEGDFEWQQVAESGNRNTAAMVGWLTGLRYLQQQDVTNEQAMQLRRNRLYDLLSTCEVGSLIEHPGGEKSAPVFSLICNSPKHTGLAASDWAAVFDATYRIEVRAGLHCAALVHDDIGSRNFGGTLRFSIGHTTTDQDLDSLQLALRELEQWKS